MRIASAVVVALAIAREASGHVDCLYEVTDEAKRDPEYLNGPRGPSTSGVSRDHLGSLPYGGDGIFRCTDPNSIALTFDDGPSQWTKGILDQFKSEGIKATFFITGYNVGRKIDDFGSEYPQLLKRMLSDGHQIGSHTWTHQNLNSLSHLDRTNQMVWNEMAFRNALGFFPTYMRPPFAVCNGECAEDMEKLGYHIIQFDIDPKDYAYNSEEKIDKALKLFDQDFSKNGSVVLSHDIKEWTAKRLVPHMIWAIKKKGLKAVTVGECLSDPVENWYRHAGEPHRPDNETSHEPDFTTVARGALPTFTSKRV